MSALNSLPLPVVRLLAFFHEELSERRPGRVPQTMQLWVGCLLVILISMTLRSLCGVITGSAVLRYSVERVLHQICGDLVCGRHGAGDRQPVFDLQMVIWRTVDPIDHCRADPDELYVFDAHPSVGAGLFAVAIVAIYGQTFPPCSTIRKRSCA